MNNNNNKNYKAKIKNKRILTGLVAVAVSAGIVAGTIGVVASINKDEPRKHYDDFEYREEVSSKKDVNKGIKKDDGLTFYCNNYGDEYYLYLEEEDMLTLIEQAMKEVDKEYVDNGNRTCFSTEDKEYSQFDKYDILGLLQTESSFRLLKIKNKNENIFNVNNYDRFQGKDANGTLYNGPGMMNEEAVSYIVETDRKTVNDFKNYNYFNIDGKLVEISYANLNAYDYVVKSGAKTQKEIEQALKENFILNVKTIYCYLNRLVKDNVKEGTHSAELSKLLEYKQFKNLSQEEAQKAFALICYNNGPGITRTAMLNGTLFDKHIQGEKAGKYKINVEYASKVMNYTKEFMAQYDYNNTIN